MRYGRELDCLSLSLDTSKLEGAYAPATPEALEGGALRGGPPPVYWSAPVLALLAQYAAVGIVQGGLASIKYPILTGYFQLEGNVLNSGSALMSLGWSLKVFFGLISDCFPIVGYHRKPYIVLGWLLTAIVLVLLAAKPPGAPAPESNAAANGAGLTLLCALACFFFIVADVAQDALLVQYAQREPDAVRGRLQSMVYAVRALFMALISLVSGVCLNSTRMAGSFDWDIGIQGFFAILAVPTVCNVFVACCYLQDEAKPRVPLRIYGRQLWTLTQKRAVWQIMIFNFVFGLLTSSVGSTAAPYVALYWAHVETLNAALLQVVGHVLFAAVLFVMGTYGTHWDWRAVLVITTLSANAIDAIVQFLTIFGVVRNQWFYLGVPLTEELPKAINFAVGAFVIVELAEDGNEGVMYGLLTTVGNLPSVFGGMLTNVMDASLAYDKQRIKVDAHATRIAVAWSFGMMYATSVVGCVTVVLLPRQKADVLALKRDGGDYPRVALGIGFLFVVVLATSITGTMASMFASTSCHVIAGGHGCLPGTSNHLYLLGIALPALLAGLLLLVVGVRCIS